MIVYFCHPTEPKQVIDESILFYSNPIPDPYPPVYKEGSPGKKIMSPISTLHRACFRFASLPLPPLRARAATLRPPPSPRRHLQPHRRGAMSSAASRLSHIAAAAGESNQPPPPASATVQDDGQRRFLVPLLLVVSYVCLNCVKGDCFW
jgi:hypothetical protein